MLSTFSLGLRTATGTSEKANTASASYAIIDAEATVVRMIYELYTVRGLSIGAITRLLNEQGVATRKVNFPLGAPDDLGDAAQPCLQSGQPASTKRNRRSASASHARSVCAAESRHVIAPTTSGRGPSGLSRSRVPPIITEETSRFAAERLQGNKDHAPRRTITPSVVQGLGVVPQMRLRPLSYVDAHRVRGRIHYYRCLGSDAWRAIWAGSVV